MKDLRRYTKNARKKRVLKKERVDLRPDNSTNSNWKVCVRPLVSVIVEVPLMTFIIAFGQY